MIIILTTSSMLLVAFTIIIFLQFSVCLQFYLIANPLQRAEAMQPFYKRSPFNRLTFIHWYNRTCVVFTMNYTISALIYSIIANKRGSSCEHVCNTVRTKELHRVSVFAIVASCDIMHVMHRCSTRVHFVSIHAAVDRNTRSVSVPFLSKMEAMCSG